MQARLPPIPKKVHVNGKKIINVDRQNKKKISSGIFFLFFIYARICVKIGKYNHPASTLVWGFFLEGYNFFSLLWMDIAQTQTKHAFGKLNLPSRL